ncbi:MAG: outer membrane beta-barrel protein [Ignavibacteria bacterium]
MFRYTKIAIIISYLISSVCSLTAQGQIDTSYYFIAPPAIQKMVIPGKAPKLTIQLSFNYNTGLMELAANDNTHFSKADFENGRNFGTRYGYGFSLTGKISLHKEGNARLNVTTSYNRFQSNFVIRESPEGKVGYNVFSGSLGLENNFNPDKKLKPYVGFDIVTSLISGSTTLKTDTASLKFDIKNSVRIGLALNLGIEYAFNDKVGFNCGIKFTHANLLLKKSKESTNPNEIYLNDESVTPSIPFSGSKQFFFSSFFAGMNFYIGMKSKK